MMLSAKIEEVFNLFGEVSQLCSKQLEMQKEYYQSLAEKLEEYDWKDLFKQGVTIKEKHGDAMGFISSLATPMRISIFERNSEKMDDMNIKVDMRSFPSLLEFKLREFGIYVGPMTAVKVPESNTEISNPFKFLVGDDKKTVRLVYKHV